MQCKLCKFDHAVEAVLLKHYRLRHGAGTWICIHINCACAFGTFSALKSHLSRQHRTVQRQENLTFHCWLCDFKDICCIKKILIHFHCHLKQRETVHCPFLGCSFETNRLNSFTGHTSKNHKDHKLKDFTTSVMVVSDFQSDDVDETSNNGAEAGFSEARSLELGPTENSEAENVNSETLEHSLASLFLRLQCLLHVSKHAIQTIIEEFNSILSLSKCHTSEIIKAVLAKHSIEIEEGVLQEISDSDSVSEKSSSCMHIR